MVDVVYIGIFLINGKRISTLFKHKKLQLHEFSFENKILEYCISNFKS